MLVVLVIVRVPRPIRSWQMVVETGIFESNVMASVFPGKEFRKRFSPSIRVLAADLCWQQRPFE